ncbi:hypothetical protein L6452_28054 [Arctium lappa]|uniref:Uncharacterized protein n=1 Tax=Arctium lappa TaxID=4217 RepID=A0ACB8ZXE0_ARCLA|nr:hypothetical protein L6452_28054 [Arctium lappa]
MKPQRKWFSPWMISRYITPSSMSPHDLPSCLPFRIRTEGEIGIPDVGDAEVEDERKQLLSETDIRTRNFILVLCSFFCLSGLTYLLPAMDEKLEDCAALLSRIEQLERERDELRNDIEQMCMQHAGPSYAAVATRMHFQRTAGLEQEINDLKKKLTACLRENVNLQEELSESYRIKNQLADLHAAELSKSMESEKQIKFFQGCVAAAFSERDNAMMEAEKAKEKEEVASQKFDIMQERIEELKSVVLEEKKLSATLQTDLEKLEKENEIFKQVITKFYDIRQHSLNEYDNIGWEDRCTSLLNDSEDMWTFTGHEESPTTKYITSLEEEVEALRLSVINLRSKLQMGMEIEKHLKKMVRDLKNKKFCLEEKMKKDISGLRSFHSQHRLDIVNLLEEESSQFKSVVNAINEKMRQLCMNGELDHLLPQRDMTLQESDCRDVHISPDAGSDAITKENVSGLPSTSTSGGGNGSESVAHMLKEKESVSDLQETCSSGTVNASEPLAQALQEKVAALLLLSQEEERYLLESNVNAALQAKLEELQKNLIQVTNEKVVALMELAQLKQDYYLLQEKLNYDVKQGKVLIGSEEKSMIHDKDGRLKSLLKKTYFSQWVNPLSSHGSEGGTHQEHAHHISKKSSSSTMDFARMKIEYTALKESLESMGHLTNSIHRLRLSLVKVKESDAVGGKSEIIENVVTEAKLLKTALGSSLPVSWSAETEDAEKVDFVSAAGFEMVELLILASHLLRNSMP